MRDARHFGRHGAQGLALAIWDLRIALDVPGIFLSKRILTHPHRALGGHPEGIPQPRIAMLREPTRSAELARLLGGEIETAELEELTIVREPTQIAGFRQDGACENRPNTRQRAEPLIVGWSWRA